jgi:signal transduction histidine kinase
MENKGLNNEIILILGSAGMLFLVASIVTFIYLFQRKLIKRKIAYQEIENLLRQEELKSAYARLQGQEAERQEIARHIHDSLASAFVTISMYADSINRAKTEADRRDLAEKMGRAAREASEQARIISHRLDSPSLHHFGLGAALSDLIATVNNSGSITIESNIEPIRPLPTEASLNVYRIAQELINNTLKHARATRISIDLSQVNTDYISLIYEDNGIGFVLNESQKRGMGLRNVQARVEKLNASMTLGDRLPTGFSVAFEIPSS